MKILQWFASKKKENKQANETARLSQEQVEALAKPVLDYLWTFQARVLELSATFKPPSDFFVFGVRNNAREPHEHLTQSVRQLDDGLQLRGKLINMLEKVTQSVRKLRESVISANGAGAYFGLCQELGKQVVAMKEYLEKFAPGYSFSMTIHG